MQASSPQTLISKAARGDLSTRRSSALEQGYHPGFLWRLHERGASWRCKQPLHAGCTTQAGPSAAISIAVIESMKGLTSDLSRAWHFQPTRILLFCATIGSSAAVSLAGRSAVINMWPYRTIGKTCMHSLTARPSSTVQIADVRWYAKAAAASPVLPHARVCIHNVHFAGADGVLRLFRIHACLCTASVTNASNGSRREHNGVERPSTQPPHCEWYAYAKNGGI